MEANPVRVIQYFDGTKQNMIPLFQRPYIWDKEKWSTLWEDILDQYHQNSENPHFLGAIVSMPVRTVPVGVNKHLIIDGQQRLLTISILLCALRSFVDERTRGIINDYLTNRHYPDDVDHLKIMPTNTDREIFNQLIIDPEKVANEYLIKKTYDYFAKSLGKADLNGQKIESQKILQVLESNLEVVMINLKDTDDPYLIFESLNHKGEPLTQGDLVRNYVLMRFRHSILPKGDQERIYHTIWSPMEISLGDQMEEFLRHYIMIDGIEIQKGGIYSAYKVRLNTIKENKAVEDYLTKMQKFAQYYSKFIEPTKENNQKIQIHLKTLEKLEKTTSFPLLLLIFDAYSNEKMDQDSLLDCFEIIESFIIRRAICDVSSNYLKKLFLSLCKNFKETDTKSWLFSTLSTGEGNLRWPKDNEVIESLKSQSFYGKKLARFVLEEVEKSFNHKEPANLTLCTIEHILPQKPTEEWKIMLGEKYIKMDKIPDEIMNNIGNLTLTGYNAELSNDEFEIKKEKLADSHIELNRWIIDKKNWSEKEILERSNLLANKIVKIWISPS